jgi:uncharacterized membrane protein
MNDVVVETGDTGNVKLVYILYLVGVVFGVTGIVGVIMAYLNRAEAPAWMQSHYQFQIRTFWIGGLYMFIGALLAMVLIGYFILLFWVVWLIVRCLKGMKYLDKGEAHPNPTGWMF